MGCRTARPKNELARIVREPDGSIGVDPSGKKPGRGAYVCPNGDCLKTAVLRKALDRALKAPVPPEAVEALRRALADHDGNPD